MFCAWAGLLCLVLPCRRACPAYLVSRFSQFCEGGTPQLGDWWAEDSEFRAKRTDWAVKEVYLTFSHPLCAYPLMFSILTCKAFASLCHAA